jgi:uncharacterized protein (TIGR02466 family)
MITNLFPQAVGIYKLGRDLTEKEISFIKGQEKRPNKGNTTSKDNTILRNRPLIKLRDFIETSVADYFKTVYSPQHSVSLRITQSWVNYTEPGQFHHKHAHPNSFVSGVFYPQANQETDRIYFYRDGFQMIDLPPAEWNTWNSKSWWFETGTGDLILFPSHLQHSVEPVQGDQTRISLSFNTFPVGMIGDEVDLTSLHVDNAQGW